MSRICRSLFLILLYVSIPHVLLANGGGTYLVSSTMRSTDPIFRDIKDITLLSEKLYIKLNSNRAEITVKYVLANNSDKDYTSLDYAFPVDYKDGIGNSLDTKWIGVDDVSFKLNGKSLDYEYSEEKIDDSIPVLLNEYLAGMSQSFVRRWFYTKLDIQKYSIINLDVHYSVETFSSCDGLSPLYMSYLDICKERDFRYDFSPAKHWGDGIIRDFYVEVDLTESFLAGDSLTSDKSFDHLNFALKGLDFKKNGDKYVHRQQNLDLNTAAPIYVSYSSSGITSAEILTKHLILPSEYAVKNSNENKKYPIFSLSDLNFETTWVANKSKGEVIEFTFEPRSDIAGLVLLGGYYKDKKTYTENNRIKTIKLEIIGNDGQSTSIEFSNEDVEYRPIYFQNMFSIENYNQYFLIDFWELGRDLPIEKIRITIEDVYSGTKYDDTCISEILFFKL